MNRFIPFLKKHPRVAVIRLQGAISASGPRGGGLNDETLGPVIERAFSRGKPAAVALVINSPGGSAVQSALIAARIRRLAAEKDVKVHTFVEDVAASGGYWLATAGDDIWIDDSSILGSIGVISAGFGFPELLAKYGIERRVHTAGKSKSLLDPFRPEKPEDVERLHKLLAPIHDSFKRQVASRRGSKLPEGQDLFTGDVWVGQQAVEVGLADGIAHRSAKLKELYGDKVRTVNYSVKRSLFRRLGVGLMHDVVDGLEERALWARFGL